MEEKLKGWFIDEERNKLLKDVKNINCISPNKSDVFNAFEFLEPQDVNVLIIGKDPYPERDKANGYAFSVNDDSKDDSIRNIFKAVDKYHPNNKDKHNSNLNKWAIDNKVLLLNSALTFDNSPFAERKKIWKPFIDAILKKLLTSNNNKLVVFLWGNEARDTFFAALKEIKKEITRKILVCVSNHPSNSSENRKGNFSILAPVHFEVCDNFLGLPIWKNL